MYKTTCRTKVKEEERVVFSCFHLFLFFLFYGFGLNHPWVHFGNCCGGDVSSKEPEEIAMSHDFLKQFPIEKDRGRSQRERERERERVLACSAFKNLYITKS